MNRDLLAGAQPPLGCQRRQVLAAGQ
jgi:hypothetical protein